MDHAMLERWNEELPHADASRRRLIVREVEARVTRAALAQTDETEGGHFPSEAGPLRKVSEMALFVAENYGMTPSTYLTRMRVCQAQYLLISTDEDISRIAFDTGFGSISRFYAAFKSVSGRTLRRTRPTPAPTRTKCRGASTLPHGNRFFSPIPPDDELQGDGGANLYLWLFGGGATGRAGEVHNAVFAERIPVDAVAFQEPHVP